MSLPIHLPIKGRETSSHVSIDRKSEEDEGYSMGVNTVRKPEKEKIKEKKNKFDKQGRKR